MNILGDWLVIALAAVPLGRVQLRLRGGVWPRSALAVLYRLKDRARIIKLCKVSRKSTDRLDIFYIEKVIISTSES